MSLGWFTLGATGDIKVTNINVGEGEFYVDKLTRRVGVGMRQSPYPIPTGMDPLPPVTPFTKFQIGYPRTSKIFVNPNPNLEPLIPSHKFAEDGNATMYSTAVVFAEQNYRPTKGNGPGGSDEGGFTRTFDSTIWVNSNAPPRKDYGTGIAFGGRTSRHGQLPYFRMTGVLDDTAKSSGAFVLETLGEVPVGSITDPSQKYLEGKPMLFERLRITGDGRMGLGVGEPDAGLDVATDIRARGGISNYGFERRKADRYTVSGSVIEDLNCVNTFLSEDQSDTWFYSLENSGTLEVEIAELKNVLWSPNLWPEQYTNISQTLKIHKDRSNIPVSVIGSLNTSLTTQSETFDIQTVGNYDYVAYTTNDTNELLRFEIISVVTDSATGAITETRLATIRTNQPPWSTYQAHGSLTVSAGATKLSVRIYKQSNDAIIVNYGTRVWISFRLQNAVNVAAASSLNSVTSDEMGNVYAIGRIGLYRKTAYKAGFFVDAIPDKDALIGPNNEKEETATTEDQDCVFACFTRDGDLKWEAKLVGSNLDLGVGIAVARNKNAVKDATNNKTDVYVICITNGYSLKAYKSVSGSATDYSEDGAVSYQVTPGTAFVIRYEEDENGSMKPCEFMRIYAGSTVALGLDVYYPDVYDSTRLSLETEVTVALATRYDPPSIKLNANDPISSKSPLKSNEWWVSVVNVGASSQSPSHMSVLKDFICIDSGLEADQLGFTDNGGKTRNWGREGTVRRGHGLDKNIYLTFPVAPFRAIRFANYFGDEFYPVATTTLSSLIIRIAPNADGTRGQNPDRIIILDSEKGVTTTSIDVDRGTNGLGSMASLYISGVAEGNVRIFDYNPGSNVRNSSPDQADSTRLLEKKAAFLMKFDANGSLEWVTQVDGPDDEFGVSVAVEQGQSKDYNVYLSGTFTSTEAKVYNAADGTNPADTEPVRNRRIAISETGIEGHRESFVLKFNHEGKYMYNFKINGNGDVVPLFIDVSRGDNLVVVGQIESNIIRLQEPDGAISRYISRPDSKSNLRAAVGFIAKFRSASTLILPDPEDEVIASQQYRKTIVNQSSFPLYVSMYKRPRSNQSGSFTNLAVIPGISNMSFLYDGSAWIPSASNKLSSNLISLDKDNGKIGFGTNRPRSTIDISGDLLVDGLMTVGREATINGRVNIVTKENKDIHLSSNFPYKVNGESIFPAGLIVMWSGSTNKEDIPAGWKLCDGTSLPDGTQVPDLRGRFVLGWSDGLGGAISKDPKLPASYGAFNIIGSTGGSQTHTLTEAEMPPHHHYTVHDSIVDAGNKIGSDKPIARQGTGNWASANYTLANADVTTNYSANFGATNRVGEGKAHDNMPPYYVLAFIIKI